MSDGGEPPIEIEGESESERPDAPLGPRRHRIVTGSSGLLLFVCLFLPAVKGCGEPVFPYELPMLWHPYLFGGALAIASLANTCGGMRAAIVLLRVLAWLSFIGGACCMALGPLGVAFVLVGGGMLAAIGTSGHSERRAAILAITVAGASIIWFTLWAVTPDALGGVFASDVAASGLLVGGILWLGEAGKPAPVPSLPRAVARRRG